MGMGGGLGSEKVVVEEQVKTIGRWSEVLKRSYFGEGVVTCNWEE